ncbi:MAG: DNA methyltransferase [Alphaproteobacteria bacterium]|nr:DNA methyltransferase [Alphaproteobacteria bacterium]
MTLSWNQIRANAAKFSEEWCDAKYEKGETHSFYNDFFEVFGANRRNVGVYEQKVKQLNDKTGFIDLFWPGTLLVEQKSAGRNLDAAKQQALDYIVALKPNEKPRYLLLSDFQNFQLVDFEENSEHTFHLSDLKNNIRHFGFIAGYQQLKYRDQDPVNIEAADLMGNLHRLLEENGYVGHSLQLLLVRIMFCLFADDTGIFDKDSFLRFIEDRTQSDGADLGAKLVELFQVLDTAKDKRQKNLDESLAEFPYVNGQLFAERIDTPAFNQAMRTALLQCCYFQWSKVSPALFGSLFQTVMLPAAQRAQGAHYTSEKNILKTIHPLFLDDLRAEFETIKQSTGTQRASRLQKFHEKLASLTFFDPACGCGNFLILAYRELRELELEVLNEKYPRNKTGERQLELDVKKISLIDVDQFYGIEIEEFPARIAETAMWLTDHQMNMKLSDMFGEVFARLPLKKAPHIHVANALRTNWGDVLPPEKCSFILGNPPFIGKAYRDAGQQEDMRLVYGDAKGTSDLDYVTCWFTKAAQYIQNTKAHVAFVSTNSITQGEQVALLWQPLVQDMHIKLHFAHRTFKWTIDADRAQGMRIASVYCVIVGFGCVDVEHKKIYEYETVKSEPHLITVNNLNPYLVDSPYIFVTNRSKPICNVPEISYGSFALDDGHFTLDQSEYDSIVKQYQSAKQFMPRFIGGKELLHNIHRYCLWLNEVSPEIIKSIPPFIEKIEQVRKWRKQSKRVTTAKLANTPSVFAEIRQPNTDYIAIPTLSSENRDYIPIDLLKQDVIASNQIYVIPHATNYHFGVLTSAMHMEWIRTVCGRLESRYRYSSSIVYNNFPWPDVNEKQRAEIEAKAQAVLDARKEFPQSSLADLYDPNTMPPVLRKAHDALDKAVDKAYRAAPFKNERERVEFLFNRYLELTEPLTAAHAQDLAKPAPKSKAKKIKG